MNQKQKPGIDEVAVRKLARRSMSTFELAKYLKGRGFSKDEIDAEIAELKSHRYLNDRQYAWSYLQLAFSKNKGKRRVVQELRQRGVSSEDIEAAMLEYEDTDGEPDEYGMAKAEMIKVLSLADLTTDDPVDEKIRGRIARKLAARGFSNSLIWELLDELKRKTE